MPEPQTPQAPPKRWTPCDCGGETDLDVYEHRSATCAAGCARAKQCPDNCHCKEERQDAKNLDQLVAFLTVRNLRLSDGAWVDGRITSRALRALEVVEAWGEDGESAKKGFDGLIEELVDGGLVVCTAKAAQRKPGKFVTLFSVFTQKHNAVFYSHVKPEILALCERGTPITLAEYKELRGNSHDWALIHRNLDDEALLYQARRTAENCALSLAKVSRWDVPTTYDDAMAMIFVPQLLQRFEALLKDQEHLLAALAMLPCSDSLYDGDECRVCNARGGVEPLKHTDTCAWQRAQEHMPCACGHRLLNHPRLVDHGKFHEPCSVEGCGCKQFKLAPDAPPQVQVIHDPGCVSPENHDGECPVARVRPEMQIRAAVTGRAGVAVVPSFDRTTVQVSTTPDGDVANTLAEVRKALDKEIP